MRNHTFWLGLGLGLTIVASASAQPLLINLRGQRTIQVTDNRRNLGEMSAIALGDVDGDGFADVAAGAPRAGAFATVDSGMVYIRYGGDYLALPATQDDGGVYYDMTARPDAVTNPIFSAVTFPDSLLRNPSGVQVFPERGGELFGSAVAVGDINNDGFADVAIAAPNYVGGTRIGHVYILLGRADLGGHINIDVEIFNNRAVEIEGRQTNSRFGEVLHFADVDNNGYDDLLIGTPREGVGGIVDVVYGEPFLGFQRASIDALPMDRTRILTNIDGERFGSCIATGDFTGDSFPEIAIGAPVYPGVSSGNGRVVVLNFNGVHPATIDLVFTPPFAQIRSSVSGQAMGTAIAIGDFDNDSLNDFCLGAPGADVGTDQNAGLVYQISDGSSIMGLTSNVPFDADRVINGTRPNELFGSAMAMAGYDMVPGDDLIVGAPGSTATNFTGGGALYVYRGGSVPTGTIDCEEPGIPITRMTYNYNNFRLGTKIAIGNFDAQFEPDIFVSGAGTAPLGVSCDDSTYPGWFTCHANREGIRVFGAIARGVPQPPTSLSVRAGWMSAE